MLYRSEYSRLIPSDLAARNVVMRADLICIISSAKDTPDPLPIILLARPMPMCDWLLLLIMGVARKPYWEANPNSAGADCASGLSTPELAIERRFEAPKLKWWWSADTSGTRECARLGSIDAGLLSIRLVRDLKPAVELFSVGNA